MDEKDEWRRHLGLPVEIELENPQGEKFNVSMTPLLGEDLMDLLAIGKNFGDDAEKNRLALNKETIKEMTRLIANSLETVPEEYKGDIASKYFLDLFPELFNINFKATATVSPREALAKGETMRKKMDELRKNDGKSPEDNES